MSSKLDACPQCLRSLSRVCALRLSRAALGQVIQELGMDWQLQDALQLRADGTLEFSGENGALLAPGLDAGRLLAAHGLTQLTHVTVAISVNSDSYNRGLGPVTIASYRFA